MRKRLIITNAIMVFLSMLILLSISVYTISNVNYNNKSKELKNYLWLVEEIYVGDNTSEVIHIFSETDKNIRITFIDVKTGMIIADTNGITDSDDHSNRLEIKSLGKVFKRYSNTLKIDMMYVAAINEANGVYIRISIPSSSITPVVENYIVVGLVSMLLILGISLSIMWPINKEVLKPLNEVVYKMRLITGNPDFTNSDSIEEISYNIDQISDLLKSQIGETMREKEKVEYVINSISQGMIVIDSTEKIIMVNDYVSSLLKVSKSAIIDKNYIYAIRDVSLQEEVRKALTGQEFKSLDIHVGKNTYYASITKVENKVILLLSDVTTFRNIEIMKREFFANASHELKSPLTSIIGYQQMINEGIIEDVEEIKSATTKTIREANRMNNIIIEMLELSKLESNLNFNIEEIQVSAIVNEVISSLEPKIKEKNITITTNLDPLNVNISNDHLFMLVKNIVDNAIKYNIENGSVDISLKNNILSIKDTGIGISSKDQSRVFERFYRVDKAKSKESGGTGLGLAIVKHICNIYNYDLELTSSLNKGTAIKIRFVK